MITRRKFLGGCASVCFINGLQLSFSQQAWANTGKSHALIYVFLRGGMDGLNFVSPVGDERRGLYEGYRPTIAVPRKGQPNGVIELADDWGFNPSAAGLQEVWQDKKLAIVHATGMPKGYSTRSHFDAQKFIERGITANASTNTVTGWLGRYLNGVTNIDGKLVPAVSAGSSETEALFGFNGKASFDSISGFQPLVSNAYFQQGHESLIKQLYAGQTVADTSVNSALSLVKTLSNIKPTDFEAPADINYPAYTDGRLKGISENFRRIAKLLRYDPDLGIHAATINFGGWDTHNAQGNAGQGDYGERLKDLTGALTAFYQEMKVLGLSDRFTIIVQSEFGRRVRENANRGTDHGTGNPLFIIGDNILGGKFYGDAPSLKSSELFASEDVPATTDYRKVFREILGKDFGVTAADLTEIFPGYNDTTELGLLTGDIAPGDPKPKDGMIFSDGFE